MHCRTLGLRPRVLCSVYFSIKPRPRLLIYYSIPIFSCSVRSKLFKKKKESLPLLVAYWACEKQLPCRGVWTASFHSTLTCCMLVCSPELLYCQPDKHGSILVASSRVVVNISTARRPRSRLGRLEGKDGMRQGSNKAYLYFCLVPAAVNCVNRSPKRSFFFFRTQTKTTPWLYRSRVSSSSNR